MLLKLADSRNLQQLLNSSGDKRKTNTNVDPTRFIEIYIEIKKEKEFKILYRKTKLFTSISTSVHIFRHLN